MASSESGIGPLSVLEIGYEFHVISVIRDEQQATRSKRRLVTGNSSLVISLRRLGQRHRRVFSAACEKLSTRFHKYGYVWGIADIAGVMGVSFKIEKRRNRCPVINFRSWLRRAEGFPGIAT
jgi:hypothetical protein